MDIDFAFLCDHAEKAGKVSALGIGFDTIYAAELPQRHHRLCVVARFRAHKTEAGRKRVQFDIIDADGGELVSIKGAIEIPEPTTKLETAQTLILNFDDLEIQRYGPHSVHILVEGIEMKRIGFSVLVPPAEG
ncbi:MAG: hypothetical protein OXP37_09565 [Chloroflexota bacterium]|nr:hypothetical protein [Chloroflexota bacterium]MDE2863130.1 hypothetical protein [Chloroflexota bacterium]MDE2937064.1 hypothetical protein [Chloroflexota bacterium]MYB16852.1 hypothetical protein [Chloroflexota bacterium]